MGWASPISHQRGQSLTDMVAGQSDGAVALLRLPEYQCAGGREIGFPEEVGWLN